jgi:hypothetical protein
LTGNFVENGHKESRERAGSILILKWFLRQVIKELVCDLVR